MMKKRTVMALALAMVLGTAAGSLTFAEEAAGEDEIMQELQAAEPAAPAAGGSVELTGEEILLNEIRTVPETCMIGVMSTEFTDQVQAVEAADDSVKIKASAGNVCLDVKLVYRHGRDRGLTIAPFFTCGLNVGGDTDYTGRLMIQAENNDGTRSWHGGDPTCTNDCGRYYLVNVENSLIPADNGYNSSEYYYLYDYIVQIPEQYATDSTPIYVLITAGETQFYYQVK